MHRYYKHAYFVITYYILHTELQNYFLTPGILSLFFMMPSILLKFCIAATALFGPNPVCVDNVDSTRTVCVCVCVCVCVYKITNIS